MGTEEKITEVGVVVGRFQVPELHQGHRDLIDFVLERHKQVCLILGVARTRSTPRNPMDFHTRYMMIKDAYKDSTNLTISSIMDISSDGAWSQKLDEKIEEMYHGKSVTLYGSRDSFIRSYSGNYPTQELESETFISGSIVREELKDKVISTQEFRAGIIYAANDRFFNAIPCVDIAVIDSKKKRILLGRKRNEELFRLPGGFVDSTDIKLEDAARRELREETGINIEIERDMKYVMSWRIDDWRYRNEKMKIMTTLFMTEYLWGNIQPGDDLHELKWFDMASLKKVEVIESHRLLIREALSRNGIPFDTDLNT